MRTLETNKVELVEAHRAEDWERAKELSQERELLKRRAVRTCEWPGCGQVLSKRNRAARHCRMHWILDRYYKRALAAASVAAVLMLVVGCAHYPIPGIDQHERRPLPRPMLPEPETRLQPQVSAPTILADAAPLSTITLAWTNEGFWTPESHQTGLVGSADLVAWYEVAAFPYREGFCTVTLTNRPAAEFYRAFNR